MIKMNWGASSSQGYSWGDFCSHGHSGVIFLHMIRLIYRLWFLLSHQNDYINFHVRCSEKKVMIGSSSSSFCGFHIFQEANLSIRDILQNDFLFFWFIVERFMCLFPNIYILLFNS